MLALLLFGSSVALDDVLQTRIRTAEEAANHFMKGGSSKLSRGILALNSSHERGAARLSHIDDDH